MTVTGGYLQVAVFHQLTLKACALGSTCEGAIFELEGKSLQRLPLPGTAACMWVGLGQCVLRVSGHHTQERSFKDSDETAFSDV